MGLRKVHFKQNFLSFPYLETEVIDFFFQKHTYILAYLYIYLKS
jgi:hypothetical protein